MTPLLAFLRKNGPMILREGLINVLAPYLIYVLAKPAWGEVPALIASSAPPTLWSIAEFIRHRRVDAVSLFVLLGIVLSLLAFIGGGGAKFLQLREKLVTVIIACVFLGSAAINRPLIYAFARASMMRAGNAQEVARMEALRTSRFFRSSMMIMTLVWGFGLLADAAVSVVLVYALTIDQYLLVNPFIGYATMGSLALWTFWFARRRRARGDAMRAAAAEAGAKAAIPEPGAPP